jgi:pilus assembly protein CpaF
MKDPVITFEVQTQGQKPRLFRFAESQVTIGFNPRCNLALEPGADNGPEIKLVVQSTSSCLLCPISSPGAFSLNGSPFLKDSPVKTGDEVAIGSCRVIFRHLPIAESAAASVQPKPVVEPPAEPDATRGPSPEIENDLEVALDNSRSQATGAAAPLPASKAPADATRAASLPPKPPAEPPAPEKPAVATKNSGLAYLYLFFAPIKAYLEDDDVAEVMINGPRQVYIERKGKLTPVPETFPNEQALEAAVMNVARSVGRFFDKDNPRLDARLPDGSRVHALKPPLCRAGTVVAIRKFRKEKLTIDQLIQFGSLTPEGGRMLDIVVKLGRNLIVSGATSSGKTSVLNVLSALIPGHERILVLEDASELQLQQPHAVCFETRKADEYGKGEVTIRDLVHSALRLRPDRLVVGEIRGGEALDLLQAMNTGHDGSMSTIHANTARDSLFRLETCALFSGIEIPLSALREQVASAIHVVVQTARLSDGTRKITGLTEVLGLKDGVYRTEDIYVFRQEGLDANGKIIGRHVFTGYQPTFLNAARQRGMDVTGLCVAP